MERSYVQRIAALAIVTSLALGGAHPAAATNWTFVERLGSFWSALTDGSGAPPAVRRAAVSRGGTRVRQAKASQTTTDKADKGWGLDPNGNSLLSPPDPSGLP
jgi:hypothetical protein